MGGKNHQPCRDYLKESTELSRSLSMAHASLDLANVALEEIILAELGGGFAACDALLDHLTKSHQHLDGAIQNIDALRLKMKERHFVDLPTVQTLDFVETGEKFLRGGIVDAVAWSGVSSTLRNRGFGVVLSRHLEEIQGLAQLTDALRAAVTRLIPAATRGEVNAVLEENHPENIRVHFAKLYSAWMSFEQRFLASAMASTETWYAFMGYGSLLPTHPAVVTEDAR